jgi:acrylyl-CoA reductase (NADPH)
MKSIVALMAEKNESGYSVSLKSLQPSDLVAGEVLLDVACSSLNYKDALAVLARGRIVRKFPMVLGIDMAGTVVESSSPDYRPGDRVVAVGQGFGESEWGGYATMQRVRADALVHLPDLLSLEDSMAIGTAGFTAMLCVMALAQAGVLPGEREVAVTGAGGGVGSIAVALLAKRGYAVAASTGRPELHDYLRELGARTIVDRAELAQPSPPMATERWAGAVDTVGGQTLTTLIAQTAYEGAVAACGMAGGADISSSVFPFILRNVALLGVSSVRTPYAKRVEAWTRLAEELDRDLLHQMTSTEPLSRIREVSEKILAGQIRGRTVIDVRA